MLPVLLEPDEPQAATTAASTAALQTLTSPAMGRAFDLGREDPRLRDRYGRHLWGQSCLLARRLAAAGSAVITIDAQEQEFRLTVGPCS